jgi:hypothetical protein
MAAYFSGGAVTENARQIFLLSSLLIMPVILNCYFILPFFLPEHVAENQL